MGKTQSEDTKFYLCVSFFYQNIFIAINFNVDFFMIYLAASKDFFWTENKLLPLYSLRLNTKIC